MGSKKREDMLWVGGVLLLLGVACEHTAPRWAEYARIVDSRICESSGIAVSRRFEEVFWTHNDDGPSTLFAVALDGRTIRSYDLPVPNRDWEDIALDKQSNLYILDNTSRGDAQWRNIVHVFPEPDPFRDDRVTSVETFEVHYEDRGFDTETIFVWQDKVFLVTKPWDGLMPRIYVAENRRDSQAVFLRELRYPAMITGGDISEDGRLVALSSYRALFIFEGEGGPEGILDTNPLVCRLNAGQIEGISWKGRDLILTNEQGSIFWVPESRWRESQAPYRDFPRAQVPCLVPGPLESELPPDWDRGIWLKAAGDNFAGMGRIAWSENGLYVGIELPNGLDIPPLDEEEQEDLDQWFLQGRIYVLINPNGKRELSYGSNDRCIVVGSRSDGVLSCEERTLLPATYVQSRHISPPWVRVERRGRWVLVTLTNEGPGLGTMQSGDRMGFNLLIMGKQAKAISWAPLTLDFSWDAPSFWGLIELVD